VSFPPADLCRRSAFDNLRPVFRARCSARSEKPANGVVEHNLGTAKPANAPAGSLAHAELPTNALAEGLAHSEMPANATDLQNLGAAEGGGAH
jgi:hypothetical protein